MKLVLSFFVALLILNFNVLGVTIISNTTNGNWTTNGSWQGAAQPTGSNADTIIIKAGDRINVGGTVVLTGAPLILIIEGRLDFGANNKLTLPDNSRIILTGSGTITSGNNSAGTFIFIGANGVWGRGAGASTNENLTGPGVIDRNSNPNSPLPISLGSFTYNLTSSSVLIQFTTTKEENFSHFEIQRSRNGQSWEVIGEVTGNGNTSEIQAYGFEDRNPLAGISYYRLNAIDIDGTQEYHGMLSVLFQPGDHEVSVYPNPVTTGRFNIQANFELREGAKVKVMDMVGAEVLNVSYDGYQQEFALPSKVREGLYVLIIQQDGLVYKKKLLVK